MNGEARSQNFAQRNFGGAGPARPWDAAIPTSIAATSRPSSAITRSSATAAAVTAMVEEVTAATVAATAVMVAMVSATGAWATADSATAWDSRRSSASAWAMVWATVSADSVATAATEDMAVTEEVTVAMAATEVMAVTATMPTPRLRSAALSRPLPPARSTMPRKARAISAQAHAQAVADFRHAMVDDPGNGGILMLMGQAMFQTGDYRNAAGATEMAMTMLPEDKWVRGPELHATVRQRARFHDSTQVARIGPHCQARRSGNAVLARLRVRLPGLPQGSRGELDKAVQIEGRIRPFASCTTCLPPRLAPQVGPVPEAQQPTGNPPPAPGQPVTPLPGAAAPATERSS